MKKSKRKSFPELERREREIRESHQAPCPNCGKRTGMHFVPPSFGDEGFYVCEAFAKLKRAPEGAL